MKKESLDHEMRNIQRRLLALELEQEHQSVLLKTLHKLIMGIVND